MQGHLTIKLIALSFMKTPLFDYIQKLNPKFFDFHGYTMPLYFTTISDEALAVRRSSGWFDVSHMGRFLVKKDRFDFLFTNFIYENRGSYGFLLSQSGGILDDVYVFNDIVVVNASNREKIKNWLISNDAFRQDITDNTVMVAIQGPQAESHLSRFFPLEIKKNEFKFYGDVFISRTGYTGEDGFEVIAPLKSIELVIQIVKDLKPCGLGARNILRLEMGYLLYGNDIDELTSPLATHYRWVLKNKNFIGKNKIKEPTYTLTGFISDAPLYDKEEVFSGEKKCGYITSGGYSPLIKKGIALARVEGVFSQFYVRRGRTIEVVKKDPPFIK